MSNTEVVSARLAQPLVDALDIVRGSTPRSAFIEKLMRSAGIIAQANQILQNLPPPIQLHAVPDDPQQSPRECPCPDTGTGPDTTASYPGIRDARTSFDGHRTMSSRESGQIPVSGRLSGDLSGAICGTASAPSCGQDRGCRS